MKRSEINAFLKDAAEFFKAHQFYLPPWAYWSVDQWKANSRETEKIKQRGLGWDVTDLGSGNFQKMGLVLFTVRNGDLNGEKNYCEKIMVIRDGQECPLHFHWNKVEDIINRGGGSLAMELYNSTEKGDRADTPVKILVDDVPRTFKAGERFRLAPGESITIERGVYHRFFGENGKVMVGEVSKVNDDKNDNRFYQPLGRYPKIEEDEAPLYPLCTEYP